MHFHSLLSVFFSHGFFHVHCCYYRLRHFDLLCSSVLLINGPEGLYRIFYNKFFCIIGWCATLLAHGYLDIEKIKASSNKSNNRKRRVLNSAFYPIIVLIGIFFSDMQLFRAEKVNINVKTTSSRKCLH